MNMKNALWEFYKNADTGRVGMEKARAEKNFHHAKDSLIAVLPFSLDRQWADYCEAERQFYEESEKEAFWRGVHMTLSFFGAAFEREATDFSKD